MSNRTDSKNSNSSSTLQRQRRRMRTKIQYFDAVNSDDDDEQERKESKKKESEMSDVSGNDTSSTIDTGTETESSTSSNSASLPAVRLSVKTETEPVEKKATDPYREFAMSNLSALVSLMSRNASIEQISDTIFNQLEKAATLEGVDSPYKLDLPPPPPPQRPPFSPSLRNASPPPPSSFSLRNSLSPSSSTIDLRHSDELRKTALFNSSPRNPTQSSASCSFSASSSVSDGSKSCGASPRNDFRVGMSSNSERGHASESPRNNFRVRRTSATSTTLTGTSTTTSPRLSLQSMRSSPHNSSPRSVTSASSTTEATSPRSSFLRLSPFRSPSLRASPPSSLVSPPSSSTSHPSLATQTTHAASARSSPPRHVLEKSHEQEPQHRHGHNHLYGHQHHRRRDREPHREQEREQEREREQPRNGEREREREQPRNGEREQPHYGERVFTLYASPRRVNLSTVAIESPRAIGHGGAANVYEVRIRPGFVCAAKVYHQYFATGDEYCERERRNLQRIMDALYALPSHANVLSILGYRFEENKLVVLMERMECSLRDLIDERRRQKEEAWRQNKAEEKEEDGKNDDNDDDDNDGGDDGDDNQEGIAEKTQPVEKNNEKKGGKSKVTRVPTPLFTVMEVLGLWKQILTGIAFLHHLPSAVDVVSGGRVEGVWLRDVKSQNVMCCRSETDWREIIAGDGEKRVCDTTRSEIHKRMTCRLIDFDEAHVVYSAENPLSPIDWQPLDSSAVIALDRSPSFSSSSQSSSSLQSTNSAPTSVRGGATASDESRFPKIASMPSMSHFFASFSHGSPTQTASPSLPPVSVSTHSLSFASSSPISVANPAETAETKHQPPMTTSGRRRNNAIERLSLKKGTVEFSAPELLNANTTYYDERVDVWSAGMVLFELLTGTIPYSEYSQFRMFDIVKSGVRPTLPEGYLTMAYRRMQTRRRQRNDNEEHGDNKEERDENEDGEKGGNEEDEEDDEHDKFRREASNGSSTESCASSDPVDLWGCVLQLFFDCTRFDPQKRPSAAALVERVQALEKHCE